MAIVGRLAAALALAAFFYCRQHDLLLLYGDAVAHINIARRVFDSQTPGLLQFGTVWLPLPHLLMLPFLINTATWQTGIGGSIPSMIGYIFATMGIFRLVRGSLASSTGPETAARVAAWGATLIFAANPNLLYLQSTAMTETVYLAFFLWAVVFSSEFVRTVRAQNPGAYDPKENALLRNAGLCLLGASLTRYDGWFLAVAVGIVVLVTVARQNTPALRRAFFRFVLIAAAGPILWVGYNAIVYRNPLEFANGPYSAKAIEERTSAPGKAWHPGSHDLSTSASYFLKSAEMNMVESPWHRVWLGLALLGTLLILLLEQRYWTLLLLWAPLPFYMLSIAYSGVPIFLPAWWPYTLYNSRYGLQLLPDFAVLAAVMIYFLSRIFPGTRYKVAVAVLLLAFTVGSYTSVWRHQPIVFREAWNNSRTRLALEQELAKTLQRIPANATCLMYLGDHVGALQQAGIPLRRTINEGNHRPWIKPADPEGLWEHALAQPAQYADFVIAFEGDAVDRGVNKKDLESLFVIHVTGQPRATIYSTLGRATKGADR
jgi:hypothetical protein